MYWYDAAHKEKYKLKNDDYKKKVEKDGDTKTKIDGETGEKKVKKD